MSEEDRALQQKLVDEIMKASEDYPNAILYMEALMEEYERLKDEVKRLNKIIDKYHEEEMERRDREMMDYLIKDEERFNDYSFMED